MNESDDESESNPLPQWLEGDSLAPPCQADYELIAEMLDFAEIGEEDYIFDLGCGDGRVCIMAAEKYGAKACGNETKSDFEIRFC
mmetsp:Transcript_6285/g.9400  ORF Transcript_6285/g.9400 Transcript_6285/m.9400 type:complete len:85 (-) Transcript_6285:9-263(-)